jgi:uncharacterized protein
MRFNVTDLLKAAPGESRTYAIDETVVLDDSEQVELIAPVTGSVRMTRDHAGVLVMGQLKTAARMACVRCLEPVDVELAMELSEEFVPTVFLPGGPPVAKRDEEDPATEIDEHHVLDLTEVVRQVILLALPLHPVCREDCAGLCPQCGINRNFGDCDCEPPRDPRWAALDALRQSS